MPPAFVLSQDQTLKFIPDLLKSRHLLKGRPDQGPPNVRIDARTPSDPTPPSAHPFPLLHNLKQHAPPALRPQRPNHRGAALIGPPHPRVNTRFSPGADKSSGRSEPDPERDALHAACTAGHASFSWKSKRPTRKGARQRSQIRTLLHLVQSGATKIYQTPLPRRRVPPYPVQRCQTQNLCRPPNGLKPRRPHNIASPCVSLRRKTANVRQRGRGPRW